MANMKNLFLGLALLVLSEVHAQDELASCVELMEIENFMKACCKEKKNWFNSDSALVYEKCKNINTDTEEGTCAYFTCFLEELGVMKDGKVQHNIKSKDGNDTNLNDITQKCLRDNQRVANNCSAIDLGTCIYFNVAVLCDAWDEKENCKKTVATAKKCKEALDRAQPKI